MARASGVFIPPSPTRDASVVAASPVDIICGIGCEMAQGSPIGIGLIAALALAAAIAFRRWRSRRPQSR